jgi:uncharacterized membrane protein
MLTEKETKRLGLYEKQMAVPKNKYILFYGVLGWGLLTGILVTIVNMLIFQPKPLSEVLRKDLWINVGVFMIGGIFFGLLMRKFLPKYINKLKDKESLP